MRKLFTLRTFLLQIILLFATTFSQAQIAGWNTFGQTAYGTQGLTPTIKDANVSVVGLTRGSGVTTTPTAAGNVWGGNGWSSVSAADAITNNKFITFSITPNEGYKMSLSSINPFIIRVSATGPINILVQYQVGSGAFTDITTQTITRPSSTSNFTLSSINLSTFSDLQNVPSNTIITFRIVPYTSTSTSGTFYIGNQTNVTSLAINGTVEEVTGANPTVHLSVSSSTGTEAAATAITVTATASQAVTGNQTVTLGVSGTGITAGDYSLSSATITIPAGGITGTATFTVVNDVEVEGTETATLTISNPSSGIIIGTNTQNITITDNDVAPPAAIVINEVYGGGGNSGSTYRYDFIELYNPTNAAVPLTGWSVQYNSAAGTGTWQVTNLTGSIPAHGYYLIQEAIGTGGTTDLPSPVDATGTIPMAAGAGKVALVFGTTALTGQNPVSTSIIDKVAYGTVTGGGFEGTASAPAPSATNSIQRNPIGFDSDNNNTDFVSITPPTPKNSVTDVTAPTLISVFPADNATGVMTSFTATITFSENIQKGTGTITLKKVSDGSTVRTFDVTSSDVTVSGTSATFNINSLLFNTAYYFEITAGAFKDGSDNNFAGLTGSSAWNFTTSVTPPAGTLGTTYNFNTCSGNLPDGFTQYSVTGPQIWGCTTFGRDAANLPSGSAPNGLQINGFNQVNIPNEDWLISPSYDLTGSSYPLLSFWSRTAFTGSSLQLKVSTNYSGTGDPNLATWTDLNGKFPAQVSDIWKLSENINLSDYKSAHTYFAFVYTSTTEDGARWTLDDITVTNSLTPPPPSLTVSATDIQYTFVANGSTADKTFTFTGNDLTGNVTLTSTGAFLLSKDGSTFNSTITYTLAEANNITKTVYVRFAPNQNNQNFTGTVTISTPGVTNNLINVKGSSIDPVTTLEVVNWNMEWFGSTTLGPANDDLQEQNATTVLRTIGADIYGLVEVVSEARLQNVVNNLNATYGAGSYSYVIANYGSHVNPPEATGQPLSEVQKEAFVYKTSIFSNITVRPMINLGPSTASYSNWSGGRYPFLMTADVTLNCVTKRINFVLIHAKANTAPILTAYDRREAAATELHDTLNTFFANENIIILGDFNDDLDQSITTGRTITSYHDFTNDPANFFSPTLALSLAGKKSTVSYNDVIDHVMISNELVPNYLPSSATILTDVASLINKYGSTTTDHYPVFTRYIFPNTTAPTVTSCPTVPVFCGTGTYTIPSFTAADDCNDVITYSYVISGATARSGSTNDASGTFNAGINTITWMATDTWGNSATCSTTVTVQQSYPYYADADNDGYGFGPVVMLCSPTTPAGYSVNNYDCDDNDKGKKRIIVCHNGSPICIDENALKGHLKHGDQLGSCTSIITSARTSSNNFSVAPVKTDISASGEFNLSNYPNPFSTSTVISYYVPVDSKVSLKIYNALGQAVTTLFEGDKKAGNYMISYNASKLTNGFYYCRLTALFNAQQFVKSIKLSVGK